MLQCCWREVGEDGNEDAAGEVVVRDGVWVFFVDGTGKDAGGVEVVFEVFFDFGFGGDV